MDHISIHDELDHIVKEFKDGVKEISLIPSDKVDQFAAPGQQVSGHLRVTLLEDVELILSFSSAGFKIIRVRNALNPLSNSQIHNCESKTFESMDSLLMTLSPLYQTWFQSSLAQKLVLLQENQ